MRAATWLVALFLTATFSACLDGDPTSSDAVARQRSGRGSGVNSNDVPFATDWFELPLSWEPGHNHEDVDQHQNLSTPNFEVLGYDPLITDYYGKTAGDYFCGDAKEKDGRRLAVVHSWGSDIAFVIADVTDPRNPEKIGELAMANTQVYDIALAPDFSYVIVSTSPFESGPDSEPLPEPPLLPYQWGTFKDACSGEVKPLMGPESGLPFHSGAALVDIRNVRNPVVTDFRHLPVLGSHSVRANEIGGETVVTVSVDNGAATASYYAFYSIMESALGGKLIPLSVYSYTVDNPAPETGVGIHMDGYIAKHPGDGKDYAWLAFRSKGLILLDMTDPAQPTFVSQWRPFNVGIHSVLPLQTLWDGKHYTILGEECGGPSRGNPSCLIYVVDTTDVSAPFLVGAWTLPIEVQWSQGLQFSMHYFDIVNRTLFVATYHGGLWALDLSDPEKMSNITTTGVFVPHLESPKPVGQPPRSLAGRVLFNVVANTNVADRPTILDVSAFPDGVIVVWDAQEGMYTLRYDETNPAPAPAPWEIKGITFPS